MSNKKIDIINFESLFDEMENGFILREAIYDINGKIYDFKIIKANKGFEKFLSLLEEDADTNNTSEDIGHLKRKELFNVFCEVAYSGKSAETNLFLRNKCLKVYSFRPKPSCVASLYEFFDIEDVLDVDDVYGKVLEISKNAEEVFWIRQNDTIIYVNNAFEKMFGIPCSRVYEDMFSLFEVVDKRDYKILYNVLKNDGIYKDVNYNIEFRILNQKRETTWLWLKTFYIQEKNGEIRKKAGTIIDITERKNMENELSRNNREINILYDLFKKASEHVDLNELLEKAQRILLEHLNIGAIFVHLYNPDLNLLQLHSSHGIPDGVLDFLDNIKPGNGLPGKVFISGESAVSSVDACRNKIRRTKLKKVGISSICSFPILYGNSVLGVLNLGIASSGTYMMHKEFVQTICNQLAVLINNAKLYDDLKQELEMRRNTENENKEIEAKNKDLERAFQLESIKMEFFANISHEFRTPINIILSAIQLIQYSVYDSNNSSPVCERHARHLKSIKQNAFRLLRLVNNLIDITKLDSGYLRLYPNNHDIVKVIENITQSVAQYIEGKGINLLFDTDVEEKYLFCDADMIERIMLNLLSNSVKYTEKGGSIMVCIKDLDDMIRISVKDTGIGIPEEKLGLIFERFVQGERPLSRRCEGSGIGLSLVKSLVELHKGRIYVNSTVNEGSEFVFELPVRLMDQSADFKGIEQSNEERIHKINVEFSDIYSLDF